MTQFPIHATSPELIPPNLIPKGEQVPGTIAGPKEYYLLNYYRQLVPNSEQYSAGRHVPHLRPHDHQRRRVRIGPHVDAGEHRGARRAARQDLRRCGHRDALPVGSDRTPCRPLSEAARQALKYLKGLITVEGTGVTLANAGLAAEDFDNIPYLS